MMENRPPLTSPDGSRNRNTPERCPRPLYSRDSTQEHQKMPQEHQEIPQEHHGTSWEDQDEGFIVVKVEDEEEMSMMGDKPCKEEETPPEISTDTQRDVKAEEEEEEHVRIKREETPIEINIDGSSNINIPERGPRPLYSWDSTQEHQEDQYSMANPSKRKRVVLTLKQKMEVCKRLEKGESRAVLMKEYNIGSSTIYDIKGQSQKIKEFHAKSESDNSVEKRHTLHTPKMEALDQALYEWFVLKRSEGCCISGPMLQEKARAFHEKLNIEGQCSFSSGWLTRFKIRHGIRKLDLSGEQKAADPEAAASFRDLFSELTADNDLTPEQIYHADETGLMWKCLPHSTLAGGNEKVAHGVKFNKERINVLVCANASGNHKVKLSVVGKYAKPRSFKGIAALPVDYHAQKHGWMDADIFTEWFHRSFVPGVKAHLRKKGLPENSKVLLLLDNRRAHPPGEELVHGNVSVCRLPPNVASLIQPMDREVIRNLKMCYRRDFMRKLIHFDGTILDFQAKFNLKDALYTAACAWDSVSGETIQRCWVKLWPAVMCVGSPSVDFRELPVRSAAAGSRVYEEICELADSMTLSRGDMNDWLAVDEAVSVTHGLDTEDIEAAANGGKMNVADEGESDDDDDEDDGGRMEDKVSWQRAIAAFKTVIAFAEQQPFFTPQHVLQLHVMQNLTLDEGRRASQRADISSFFKKVAHKFDSKGSSAKQSPSPDPVPATSPDPDAMSEQ